MPEPNRPNASPQPSSSAANEEVTVEFLRWTAWGHHVAPTAYQKGQRAGFTLAEAEKLVRGGHAVIVGGGTAMQRARSALGY